MPPKTKRKTGSIGQRERRALGIPSPVGPANIDVNVDVPVPTVSAAPAPIDVDIVDPELSQSKSMVMVTPEEQQQQPEVSQLSPIAAAEESINNNTPKGSPRIFNMDDSSIRSSPNRTKGMTPFLKKLFKKKIT